MGRRGFARQSCVACHQRKVRCDLKVRCAAGLDSCSACQRRNQPCKWREQDDAERAPFSLAPGTSSTTTTTMVLAAAQTADRHTVQAIARSSSIAAASDLWGSTHGFGHACVEAMPLEMDNIQAELFGYQFETTSALNSLSYSAPTIELTSPGLFLEPASDAIMVGRRSTEQVGCKAIPPSVVHCALKQYREGPTLVARLISVDQSGSWSDSGTAKGEWSDLLLDAVVCHGLTFATQSIHEHHHIQLQLASHLHVAIRQRLDQDEARLDMTLLAILLVMSEVWPEMPVVAELLAMPCTADESPLMISSLMLTLLDRSHGTNHADLNRHAAMLWYTCLFDVFTAVDQGIPPLIPISAFDELPSTSAPIHAASTETISSSITFSEGWLEAAKGLARTAHELACQVASAQMRTQPLATAGLERTLQGLDACRRQILRLDSHVEEFDDMLALMCCHCYMSLESHYQRRGVETIIDGVHAAVLARQVETSTLQSWRQVVNLCCSPKGVGVLRLSSAFAQIALGCTNWSSIYAKNAFDTGHERGAASVMVGCRQLIEALDKNIVGVGLNKRLRGLKEHVGQMQGRMVSG